MFIACDWYLAVVYLAQQLSGVLTSNLILLSKDLFCFSKMLCLSSSMKLGPDSDFVSEGVMAERFSEVLVV